jgi:hypothetical protein
MGSPIIHGINVVGWKRIFPRPSKMPGTVFAYIFLTKSIAFVIQKREGKMKSGITKPVLIALFAISLLLAQSPAFAGDTLKDIISKKYHEEKDICPVVKETILEGQSSKDCTKTSIQLGHDACLVIRCAIEAKGQVDQVIAGALEAGATSDVCSRCAINAGADPAAVAKALETGLGYSLPLAAGLEPVEIGLPGGNRSGGNLSPSGF